MTKNDTPRANRVKYGLKNLYYAVAEVNEMDNTATYGKPVRWPGAVSLSMPPQGGETKFFADDGIYFSATANNGYSGDLECALVPDSFRKDVQGEITDANGVDVDDTNAVQKPFALLFEFQGDQHARRHVLYNCTAGRPEVSSKTKGETIEPQTEKVSVTAAPIHCAGLQKDISKATAGPGSSAFADWYKAVYQPVAMTESTDPGTTDTAEE